MDEDADKAARLLDFILELRQLTLKHGVAIGGCGCCGSPWLDENADVSDERAGYIYGSEELRWIAPGNKYDWENYAADIVRPKAEGSVDGLDG